MSGAALERVFREASGRIVGALAARFRDLALAEDAFAEACARALEEWPATTVPADTAAWLYQVALRVALDSLRRQKTQQRFAPLLREDDEETGMTDPTATDADTAIPDERLRLIFICCHPAVSVDARAALTLRLVCGLSTLEIARAFLVPETTLAQRLTRAKQKIADAKVPFEVPGREQWADRLDAVLSTLEVAYSKAHEDAAGTGGHAHYAAEMLALSAMTAALMPLEPDALALAAVIHLSEARRPARVNARGEMVPLSEQDPGSWDRKLIEKGLEYLESAGRIDADRPRVVRGLIQGCWCRRGSLAEPAPWEDVLRLYDRLVALEDSPLVRLNRAVAVAEVRGAAAAREELEALDRELLGEYAPYHATCAEIYRRCGEIELARGAYDRAIELVSTPVERSWLLARREGV